MAYDSQNDGSSKDQGYTQSYDIDINELQREEAFKPNIHHSMISEQKIMEMRQRIKQGSTSTTALPQFISNISGLKMAPEFIIVKPFYTDLWLERMSNAFLFDDVINSAIERLSFFTLGATDEIRSTLYPDSVKPINSAFEAKNELKKIKIIRTGNDIANSIINSQFSDQEITNLETGIHQIDKICKLGRFLKKNYRGAHVFSRSASYIEHSPQPIDALGLPAGVPIALKPLKPMQLGNVCINPNSWDIEAVQYLDNKILFQKFIDIDKDKQIEGLNDIDRQRYIPKDNILYFVRGNNNMMKEEDDFYFGHSTIQPIINQSEENRRLNQIVIPSINQQLWAGMILWTFPGYTNGQMRNFFKNVRPGQHIGIPDDRIKAQPMQIEYDYQGLMQLRQELKKSMLSVFGMPSFLMNFEEANTKATAEAVVIGFNESTIQAERSWLADILDEQWYNKIFSKFYPADEYIHIKMKMIIEFENISFESFLEKAVALVALIDKKMVTLSEVRQMLKLPPLLPQDYIELGLSPPGQLVDPATQGVPAPINQVESLMAQMQKQEGQTIIAGKPEPNTLVSGLEDKTNLNTIKNQILNRGGN